MAKSIVQKTLSSADIIINGSRPWDIRVRNPRFYSRVLSGGSLALGETYMDAWWEVPRLDIFFDKLLRAQIDKQAKITSKVVFEALKARLQNLQTVKRASKSIQHHYDVGNDLYEAMLDKGMNYSCAYWPKAKTLDKAQENKLDMICKKMKLKKGMRVLDIGCGWGGFAEFAAKKYGVEVVGVTISPSQAEYARKRTVGLPVRILLQDYRKIKGDFDAIVSIGMIEHVGYKNFRTYMKVAYQHLKEKGIFLLHTIAGNASVTKTDPWIGTYIFPHSMLPSAKQLSSAFEGLFVLEDWHSFGVNYDKTLMAWHHNFVKAWPKLKKNYSDRFKRMWEYYLLCCAGSFRCRNNQLYQLVLSKGGVDGGYERPIAR